MPNPVKESTSYNVTIVLADTEYSQALPSSTRELRFRCRTLFDVRFAWVTGKVATPTAPYFTLPAGMDYVLSEINLTSKIIYLASSQTGVIVEIEEWS